MCYRGGPLRVFCWNCGGYSTTRSGRGQSEQECTAVREFAFGADQAAVGAHDVLGDGQAEAGTPGFAGAGFVDAVEALKQARQVLGGDARTVIANIEFDASLRGLSTELDSAAGAPVLHGIVDQVRKYLVNRFPVREHWRKRLE